MTTTPQTETARYRVDYRRAGTNGLAFRTEVSLTDGYTTFESIRTILAVAEGLGQRPETIEVLELKRVPTDAETAELHRAIGAYQASMGYDQADQ